MGRIKEGDGVYRLDHLFMFLVGMFVMFTLVLLVDSHDDDGNGRIERVEGLMTGYSGYGYSGYLVTENMTISEASDYYFSLHHELYRDLFMGLMLDYVCDGTGEEVFTYLVVR